MPKLSDFPPRVQSKIREQMAASGQKAIYFCALCGKTTSHKTEECPKFVPEDHQKAKDSANGDCERLEGLAGHVGDSRKASNAQILESYANTGSVWKTASDLKMCGQSVHERLVRLGVNMGNWFTDSDREKISAAYSVGFKRGDGVLESLSSQLNRSVTTICREARKMGLTSQNRTNNDARMLAMKGKRNWKVHPRGMLGKKHTQETKDTISKMGIGRVKSPESVDKMLKTRLAKHGHLCTNLKRGSWRAAWREIGGFRIFARSRWEANFARYLDFLKASGEILAWEHEPETFWFEKIKRGCRSYLPGFRVTKKDGTIMFYEVKGWMDARSKTKLKRMKKYHPTVVLEVVGADWFKRNSRNLSMIIKEWETK